MAPEEGTEVETDPEAAGAGAETDTGAAGEEAVAAAAAEAAEAEAAGAAGDEAKPGEGEEERKPLSPRLVGAAERAGWTQEDLDEMVEELGPEKAEAYLEKVATGFDRQSAELGESGKLLREQRRAGAVEEAPFAESGADVSVLTQPLKVKIPPAAKEWMNEYAPEFLASHEELLGGYEAMRQLTVSLMRRVNEQHGRHVKGELDGFYGGHKDMAPLFADAQFKAELQRTAQDIWLASRQTKRPRSIAEAMEAALWSMPQARETMQKGAGERLKGKVRGRQGKLLPKPKHRVETAEAKGDAKARQALQDEFGIPP